MFGILKDLYSRKIIDDSLNKYGAMFPSVYQLLPIYSTPCMPAGMVKLPAPVVTASGASGSFDLFSAEAWKAVGWPKYAALGSKLPCGMLALCCIGG